MTDDRYQNQPWHIRLWRRRHQLTVPYVALRLYLRGSTSDSTRPWSSAWHWALGEADLAMKWYYTGDEIEEMLDKK